VKVAAILLMQYVPSQKHPVHVLPCTGAHLDSQLASANLLTTYPLFLCCLDCSWV
jgi:hypothetical protein